MALWRRRRRRAEPYAAVTDEERISRYLYLLGTLPPSVVENAHRTAFAELPPALQASRRYYVGWVEASYSRLASWLAVLGAWRALWPDPPPAKVLWLHN